MFRCLLWIVTFLLTFLATVTVLGAFPDAELGQVSAPMAAV